MSLFQHRSIVDENGEPLQSLSGPGAALLRALEGESLTAYEDAAGVWTVGAGHTGVIPKPVRDRFQLDGIVTPGMTITKEASEALLSHDIAKFEAVVRESVAIPLLQHEFDALVLLAFNIGRGSREKVGFSNSTLVRLLNRDERDAAADEFLKWRLVDGMPLEALEKRRAVERHLFLTGEYDQTPYDGDLADAIVPAQWRGTVSPPVTEPRPSLNGSRTIDASRKGGGASIIAVLLTLLAMFKDIFGPDVFDMVPHEWVLGLVVAAVAYAFWQHVRSGNFRFEDWIRGAR